MNVTGTTLLAAGAAGVAAIGAGIGAGALAGPWRSEAKGRDQDERYAEIDEMVASSAKQHDGRVIYPFPTWYRDEGEGYASVISVMAPGAAGLAAAGFGAMQLFKGGASIQGKLLGAAGLIAGGALLGAVVGGIRGSGQGERASDARHGIDVDAQVAEVMRNFDRDGDGGIDITESPTSVPEYERRNTNSTSGTVTYVSIKDDAIASDVDQDGRVTASELRTRLESIDTDGNSVISHPEAKVRHEIETYGVDDALLSHIG